MAVDSNVLIYERIREEHRAGRSIIQSIDVGFSRALATILDANITTLIAAVVLFYLGSGPVRGFAVTLAIGIVTSVFTRLHADPLAGGRMGAPPPAEGASEGAHLGAGRRGELQVHGDPAVHLRAVDSAVARDGRRPVRRQHELRHRLHGRHDGRGPGEGREGRHRRRSARRSTASMSAASTCRASARRARC